MVRELTGKVARRVEQVEGEKEEASLSSSEDDLNVPLCADESLRDWIKKTNEHMNKRSEKNGDELEIASKRLLAKWSGSWMGCRRYCR